MSIKINAGAIDLKILNVGLLPQITEDLIIGDADGVEKAVTILHRVECWSGKYSLTIGDKEFCESFMVKGPGDVNFISADGITKNQNDGSPRLSKLSSGYGFPSEGMITATPELEHDLAVCIASLHGLGEIEEISGE